MNLLPLGRSSSNKGVPIRYSDGEGTCIAYLPRAKMWIEFESPTELLRIAELLGVKCINKRKQDYVFALEGTVYYAKE